MTDDVSSLEETIASRRDLYPPDLKDQWQDAIPDIRRNGFRLYNSWPFFYREKAMFICGHEVMSSYELPYMEKLAEIVTRNGGDILEIGYGLGLASRAIERRRRRRCLQAHYLIELNRHLAAEVRRQRYVTVLEGDWRTVFPQLQQQGKQFRGILYDGYPLELDEIHRDGVPVIQEVVNQHLLEPGGSLTFYADAPNKLGAEFRQFLADLGFSIETELVSIKPPRWQRQSWRHNHFVAPILTYGKRDD